MNRNNLRELLDLANINQNIGYYDRLAQNDQMNQAFQNHALQNQAFHEQNIMERALNKMAYPVPEPPSSPFTIINGEYCYYSSDQDCYISITGRKFTKIGLSMDTGTAKVIASKSDEAKMYNDKTNLQWLDRRVDEMRIKL
jgi:hypothetical protein